MFKDYKGILKNLRDMQDQLWKESLASFPGSAFPADMNEWQQQTLENVNKLVQQAVTQSLDLQREWLEQWTERASGKKLKPKLFAELSADASNSTQQWLDNQNRLWDQWIEVLRGSGGPGSLAGIEDWEKAVQESIQGQMALLNDWTDMAGFEKLSVKEVSKLSNQIEKAMQKSIETQQRLWSHWFDTLGVPEDAGEAENQAAATKPKPSRRKTTAKTRKAAGRTAQEDLKQISGIGPGLEKKLKDAGISTLQQIAELSREDIARLEEQVIRFPGRIRRDQWVKQARKLIS